MNALNRLTEQTREWEKGHQAAVLRGVRRYSVAALGISVVLVPPLVMAGILLTPRVRSDLIDRREPPP